MRPPFIPSVTLPAIPEDSESSSTDAKHPNTGHVLPAAPQKGPTPLNRYQASTPTPSGSAISSIPPPLDTTTKTIPPLVLAQLRRSPRETKQLDRLQVSYLRALQGRVPLSASAAYATFPFPAQPVIPAFLPTLPDLGPNPVTYREALSSPDCDM